MVGGMETDTSLEGSLSLENVYNNCANVYFSILASIKSSSNDYTNNSVMRPLYCTDLGIFNQIIVMLNIYNSFQREI